MDLNEWELLGQVANALLRNCLICTYLVFSYISGSLKSQHMVHVSHSNLPNDDRKIANAKPSLNLNEIKTEFNLIIVF